MRAKGLCSVDPSSWRRRRMKKERGLRRIGVVLCCLVAIFLAGCATARGVGQDTQSLGRSIEKQAQ
jgi:predicted small secreted protein